jgi:hypothetical protein
MRRPPESWGPPRDRGGHAGEWGMWTALAFAGQRDGLDRTAASSAIRNAKTPSTNQKWSINGAFGANMVGCKSYALVPCIYATILTPIQVLCRLEHPVGFTVEEPGRITLIVRLRPAIPAD